MTEHREQTEAILRDWVREGRVTWEIAPLGEQVDHSRINVGFEVRLFAQHPDGAKAGPGCEKCGHLFEQLRAIALATLPKEHRPSKYEIAPFDASFHHRPETGWASEVQLTIRIEHRDGHFRGIDECEKRCAEEIQHGLKRLGARSRSWSERPTA